MEEVRLWKIVGGKPGVPTVHRVEGVDATATEQLLEDVLARSPEVLMPGLTLIGRQNETQGGPLDLLGVDEDGRLVVFELKRGELTRLAVAQVLDYASSLNGLETSDLSDRITEMSGRGGTEKLESFAAWYQENYNKALAEIGRPRMVLVGLGVDAAAKRIVEFLAEANLDISLITFYGFRENGETFLARQVEVEARGPAQVARASKAENQAKLRQRLQETGLEAIYGTLQAILC
jgi:Endonuclease NucS